MATWRKDYISQPPSPLDVTTCLSSAQADGIWTNTAGENSRKRPEREGACLSPSIFSFLLMDTDLDSWSWRSDRSSQLSMGYCPPSPVPWCLSQIPTCKRTTFPEKELLLKDEFITWLSSRPQVPHFWKEVKKILAATNIPSYKPEEKCQGDWEWRRMRGGASIFLFYHWISSSTDTSQATFIACIISTLYAGEFCWDSKRIKEIEIRSSYWFWCSN